MKTIDIHAHLVPKSLWQAADAGRDWYGFRHEPGDGIGTMVSAGKRTHFSSPKVRFTPEERMKDMDAQGVDVQIVSPSPSRATSTTRSPPSHDSGPAASRASPPCPCRTSRRRSTSWSVP